MPFLNQPNYNFDPWGNSGAPQRPMKNPFAPARMLNVFGGIPQEEQQPNPAFGGTDFRKRFLSGVDPRESARTPQPSRPGGLQGMIEKLLSEEDEGYQAGPAVSAYKQSLAEQPKYADYKPTVKRKILAGIVGGLGGFSGGARSGAELGQRSLDRPYSRAVDEYGARVSGLKEAADLERGEEALRNQHLQARYKNIAELIKEQREAREGEAHAEYEQMMGASARDRALAALKTAEKGKWERVDYDDGTAGLINPDTNEEITIDKKTLAFYDSQTRRTAAGAQVTSANAASRNAATAASIAPSTVARNYATAASTSQDANTRSARLEFDKLMKSPKTAEQQNALQLSFQEVANDPAFRDAFDMDAATAQEPHVIRGDIDEAAQRRTMNEVRRRAAQHLGVAKWPEDDEFVEGTWSDK